MKMAENFIQFNLDKTDFLLASEQILSIEAATDINWKDTDKFLCGEIVINGLNIPVFNFDENLAMDNAVDPKRKICLCLRSEAYLYGLPCEQVNTVNTHELKIVELPLCTKTQNTPVINLAIKEQKIINMIDTNSIGRLIDEITRALDISAHIRQTHIETTNDK